MAAQVGTITERLGGKDRVFSLLTMDDLVTLTNRVPSPTGELIDISALDKFSKSVQGCAVVLWLASRRLNPAATLEESASNGSILRRTQIASQILIASLVSGEEPEAPKEPGQEKATNPA